MRVGQVSAEVEDQGALRVLRISAGDGSSKEYRLQGAEQQDYISLYEQLARGVGTRLPHNSRLASAADFSTHYRPLLTRNLTPEIPYGYGDPAVLHAGGFYYLFVTSNDAPNAFPILRSANLVEWEHAGFVFPKGSTPAWAATGAHVSDYWAPEVQLVGERYLLCFSARDKEGELCIGLATAPEPEGPYTPFDEPLTRGGVIDAHIFVDAEHGPLLFWKEDSNDLWPGLVAEMLAKEPVMVPQLFSREEDRRTASLTASLWPWISKLQPMERFFALQPLIEAVAENFRSFRDKLLSLRHVEAVEAMQTPIYGQRLSTDGLGLTGERHVVLANDLQWEAHLIEGPWVTRQQGRYYLFYAGNDFSTADYGIGVAVAEHPFGLYRKMEQPLLRSTSDWAGPGHPSVACAPDGSPRLFFHAFRPGAVGYKEFRALLTVGLDFTPEGVTLRP